MRVSKIWLSIALVAFTLIILAIVSFFTAANCVFLTVKEPVQSQETATTPGAAIATEPAGIRCKLTNYSVRPVYYGARFSIVKQVDYWWEVLPTPEDLRFPLGISVVQPFSSVELFYPTSLFTERYGDGTYRIIQNVWAGDSQNAERHPLYCKFSVGAGNK